MKRANLYILLLSAAVFSFASCKKNNHVIGKEVTPPAFVKIGTMNNADTVGTYVVKNTNAPFKIPIGVTNVSNQDRTINLSYSSPTATEGVEFTGPKSIVIKAGEAIDSVDVTGNFDSFQDDVELTHKITVTITGGDVPLNPRKTNYNITMKMYWDADVNAFSGTYIIQDYDGGEPDGGPYEVEVVPVSGNGPQTIVNIIGLWGSDVPVKVVLDWTNREKGESTVPKANFYVHPTYGQMTINPNGKQKFNAVTGELKIGYENTVSAGSFGKYTSTLTKK